MNSYKENDIIGLNRSSEKIEEHIDKIDSEILSTILSMILEENFQLTRDIDDIKRTINENIENKLDSIIQSKYNL